MRIDRIGCSPGSIEGPDYLDAPEWVDVEGGSASIAGM